MHHCSLGRSFPSLVAPLCYTRTRTSLSPVVSAQQIAVVRRAEGGWWIVHQCTTEDRRPIHAGSEIRRSQQHYNEMPRHGQGVAHGDCIHHPRATRNRQTADLRVATRHTPHNTQVDGHTDTQTDTTHNTQRSGFGCFFLYCKVGEEEGRTN